MEPTDASESCGPTGALPKTNEQWKQVLTPMQFHVTREKGTERPFTGEYWNCQKPGVYHCVCCGLPLFVSETKFDAGCGWPSFWQPIEGRNINSLPDYELLMERTEVRCAG